MNPALKIARPSPRNMFTAVRIPRDKWQARSILEALVSAKAYSFPPWPLGLFDRAGAAGIEAKLRIRGASHDFDMQERARSAFGKEWVHRLQHPTLPPALRLGNLGVEHECAVEVEFIRSHVEYSADIYGRARNGKR